MSMRSGSLASRASLAPLARPRVPGVVGCRVAADTRRIGGNPLRNHSTKGRFSDHGVTAISKAAGRAWVDGRGFGVMRGGWRCILCPFGPLEKIGRGRGGRVW